MRTREPTLSCHFLSMVRRLNFFFLGPESSLFLQLLSNCSWGYEPETFFSFPPGPGSENFLINATTAVIITRYNNSLDRERNDTYHMTLTASDGRNQTTSVPLLVKITDVNDERPRFSQQVYYANISEDAARGTTVRRVTATDLDFLILNKEITYTSTGADAKFYINRATGL